MGGHCWPLLLLIEEFVDLPARAWRLSFLFLWPQAVFVGDDVIGRLPPAGQLVAKPAFTAELEEQMKEILGLTDSIP